MTVETFGPTILTGAVLPGMVPGLFPGAGLVMISISFNGGDEDGKN